MPQMVLLKHTYWVYFAIKIFYKRILKIFMVDIEVLKVYKLLKHCSMAFINL